MSKVMVVSSNYGGLHFMTSEEAEAFGIEERALWKKHHELLKKKYGIWAGNQDKYVPRVEDLNSLDSYPHPLDLEK